LLSEQAEATLKEDAQRRESQRPRRS
jgi:hypothetical protein